MPLSVPPNGPTSVRIDGSFTRIHVGCRDGTSSAEGPLNEGRSCKADRDATTSTTSTNGNPTAETLSRSTCIWSTAWLHTFMRRLPRSVQARGSRCCRHDGTSSRRSRVSAHTCSEMFARATRAFASVAPSVDELRRHDWSPRRRRTNATDVHGETARAAKTTSSPLRGRNGTLTQTRM